MGPTRWPPGACRPQMGPMLAPWTLLLGCRYQGLHIVSSGSWAATCRLLSTERLRGLCWVGSSSLSVRLPSREEPVWSVCVGLRTLVTSSLDDATFKSSSLGGDIGRLETVASGDCFGKIMRSLWELDAPLSTNWTFPNTTRGEPSNDVLGLCDVIGETEATGRPSAVTACGGLFKESMVTVSMCERTWSRILFLSVSSTPGVCPR